jgi:hypothetical protein
LLILDEPAAGLSSALADHIYTLGTRPHAMQAGIRAAVSDYMARKFVVLWSEIS